MATGPNIPTPRRLPIHPAWLLWVGMVTMVAFLTSVALGASADDESVGNASRDQPAATVDPIVYRWVFGETADAVAARKQLHTLLWQKIRAVDLTCKLTDTQTQRLDLAGRGDNNRLLDRVEEIGTRFELVKNDPDKVAALAKEARRIKRGVIEPGLSNDGSLFVKVLEKLLTHEQTANYEPLRPVFRAGGTIRMGQRAGREVLQIFLDDTAFADDGLADLKRLTYVDVLGLDGTQVTDEGLAHLKEMTSLQGLWLNNTQVSDAGLVHLKELNGLHTLVLTKTTVTDAGLANLNGLDKLVQLSLDDTRVTDEGLIHLKGLINLRKVYLVNTQVSDMGLAHLKGLRSLRWLELTGTRVTDAGVAELRRALPELSIER